jgi:hypothetical protein
MENLRLTRTGGNMKSLLVTNNGAVNEKFKNKMEIIYLEGYKYIEVLEFIRDKIHEGHKLLTHPLSGSIKPNETPYKSIMISREIGELDTDGLVIIEDSIQSALKFMSIKATPEWKEKVLEDFRVIDLSLMENVIEKLGHH